MILQQNKAAESYHYDYGNGKLTPAEVLEIMKKQALAYALWGNYSYKQKLYRMEEKTK